MTPQIIKETVELYPGKSYEDFGIEFLTANPITLQAFCKNERLEVRDLPKLISEILTEWRLRGVTHTGFNTARSHLINHIRIKKYHHAKRNNDALQDLSGTSASYTDETSRMARIAAEILRQSS